MAQIYELDANTSPQAYSEGLAFLLELELINNPAVANALVLNIFRVSNRIKDTELLTDYENKRMLVWIELDWLGTKFFEKKIRKNIEQMLMKALPSYDFRVVSDRLLFDKAIKLSLNKPPQRYKDAKNTKNPA